VSESRIVEWSKPESEDEVRSLLERARGGDPTDLAALRQAMDRYPQIWREYGDLAGHARDAWFDLIAGSDLALKESLARQIEAMKAELAGESSSPLETLLIERIAACWLQLSYADATAARTGEMSTQQANYLRKRQDSAHRRYLAAIGSLAMVRRLLGSAAKASGTTRSSLATTDPARVVGCDPATDERGERRNGSAERDHDEDDLLLEFSSPRSDLPVARQRGPARGSKNSSRSGD